MTSSISKIDFNKPYKINSSSEMYNLGAVFAECTLKGKLFKNFIKLGLKGKIASGKTEFVKGVLSSLNTGLSTNDFSLFQHHKLLIDGRFIVYRDFYMAKDVDKGGYFTFPPPQGILIAEHANSVGLNKFHYQVSIERTEPDENEHNGDWNVKRILIINAERTVTITKNFNVPKSPCFF